MNNSLWINVKLLRLILTGVIVWIAAGGVVNADHHLGDEGVTAAIKAVNQKLMDCMNSGDAACAAMLYTTDAVYMAPNAEPLKGKDAIGDGMVGDGTFFVQLISDEVEVYGDTASELGTYITETKDGQHLDHGSYVVIWKQTEDGWKLHWDIFNTNMAGN